MFFEWNETANIRCIWYLWLRIRVEISKGLSTRYFDLSWDEELPDLASEADAPKIMTANKRPSVFYTWLIPINSWERFEKLFFFSFWHHVLCFRKDEKLGKATMQNILQNLKMINFTRKVRWWKFCIIQSRKCNKHLVRVTKIPRNDKWIFSITLLKTH